jgi:peptidoglycan/LPS O-acetylase OafA/YrhL
MTTTEPVAGPSPRAPADAGADPGAEAPAAPGRAATGPAKPDVSLPYVAGFDGMRGAGLLVMLAYHHGAVSAKGGIFTVSMFLTLSGFLIATLALAEWAKADRVSLPRFWERRVRRLLPAALLTITMVVALQYFFHVGSGPRFRGDALSAIYYGANWRMAYSGADYGALFQLESPVQHFWSLAIEEQFYLAFPLLFVGMLALVRRRWGLVGLTFGAGAAASYVLAWVSASNNGNSTITYYATYTRVSEIMTGVALAFLLATAPAQRFLAGRLGSRLVAVGGIVGVVGWAYVWHSIGINDDRVFHGATIVNAGFTALVILACTNTWRGPVAVVFSLGPVAALGRLSYGVYLLHWPLFLLLDWDRLGHGISFWQMYLIRSGITITLAVLMSRFVESPFRYRMKMPPRLLAALSVGAMVTVAALVLVVPVHEAETVDLAEVADLTATSPFVPNAITPSGEAAGAPRILFVGDSVAWSAAIGFDRWNKDHEQQQVSLDAYVAVACTLSEASTMRSLGMLEEPNPACRGFRDDLPGVLAEHDYDAIVVMMGQKDLGEKRVDGKWRHLGDPVFDEWLRPQVASLADILAADGAPVFWSTAADVRLWRANVPDSSWDDYPDNDPARARRLNEIVTETLAGRAGFRLLDVRGWLEALPGGQFDPGNRADGVHLTVSASDELARWAMPQILPATATTTG